MPTPILILIALTAGGCLSKPVKPLNHSMDSSLSQFAFVIGTWSETKGGITTSEHWIAPGGKMLLGVGTTVKSGETLFFEYLRVESREDGIFYIPQPKGNPPTEFRMVECVDDRVTFENPRHDFPTRIIYQKINATTLKARIEGKRNVADASDEWLYKKLK